jgi:hypothetical protein
MGCHLSLTRRTGPSGRVTEAGSAGLWVHLVLEVCAHECACATRTSARSSSPMCSAVWRLHQTQLCTPRRWLLACRRVACLPQAAQLGSLCHVCAFAAVML